jgi:hypothetical protein
MKALALVAAACVAGLATAGSRATASPTGTLSGTTQVSFGCPGPVSPAGPSCHPWHLFPYARFSISRRSTDGTPVPMTAIVVTSNAKARFSLRLDAGSYLITPLAQYRTHGGPRLTVRVRAAAVTTVLVRFVGFPQMA